MVKLLLNLIVFMMKIIIKVFSKVCYLFSLVGLKCFFIMFWLSIPLVNIICFFVPIESNPFEAILIAYAILMIVFSVLFFVRHWYRIINNIVVNYRTKKLLKERIRASFIEKVSQ